MPTYTKYSKILIIWHCWVSWNIFLPLGYLYPPFHSLHHPETDFSRSLASVILDYILLLCDTQKRFWRWMRKRSYYSLVVCVGRDLDIGSLWNVFFWNWRQLKLLIQGPYNTPFLHYFLKISYGTLLFSPGF